MLPRSGQQLEDLDREAFTKLVIVRRRWRLRLVYELVDDDLLVVHYVDPGWMARAKLSESTEE